MSASDTVAVSRIGLTDCIFGLLDLGFSGLAPVLEAADFGDGFNGGFGAGVRHAGVVPRRADLVALAALPDHEYDQDQQGEGGGQPGEAAGSLKDFSEGHAASKAMARSTRMSTLRALDHFGA